MKMINSAPQGALGDRPETAGGIFEPHVTVSVVQEALAQWGGEPTREQALAMVVELVSSCGLDPALVRNVIDQAPPPSVASVPF
jgi:hypothetical protein